MKYPVSEIATVFMCCVLFLLAVYTWVSGWPVDYVGYVSNRTDQGVSVPDFVNGTVAVWFVMNCFVNEKLFD